MLRLKRKKNCVQSAASRMNYLKKRVFFFGRKKKKVDADSAVWIFTSVRELDK